MKTDLLMLMLCSVFFHLTLATHRLRYFLEEEMSREMISWTKSSIQCKNKNASLITLYDEDDAKFMGKMTGLMANVYQTGSWLGLIQKSQNWSGPVDPGDEQKCVAIHENETKTLNCTEQKFFLCNTNKGSTLVNIRKTWCQALQHCRQHYNTSLANSSSTAQMGHNHSYWIAERYDKWQWHDKSCSPFRKWVGDKEHHTDENYTVLYHETAGHIGLYKFGYKSHAETVCSRGTVRIKVINDSKTWEDAYDYCKDKHTRLVWIRDENDQAAVEQWLTYTDTDIGNEFWIGLKHSRIFGFWIWSSDTTVGYHYWKDGRVPQQPSSHLCGIIDKNDDMKWRDEECTRELPFLCEEDIVYLD